MKIVTLVENTCGAENCIAEHGLSIYIETEKHRLLLDTGQTDAVVRNAEALGIDLRAVDTVILSHGHYDHTGGVMPFSRLNSSAQIIMQHSAAEPHSFSFARTEQRVRELKSSASHQMAGHV